MTPKADYPAYASFIIVPCERATIYSIILWISIIAGTLAAAAALYGQHKVLPKILTGPAVCKMEAGGCQVLFRTKEATLMGPSNALLGIILYLLLAVGLLVGLPIVILLLAATAGVALSIYLGWYLFKKD
jgi:uncharacterized membrane protein